MPAERNKICGVTLEAANNACGDAAGCCYYYDGYHKPENRYRQQAHDKEDEFVKWYIDQTARLVYEQIENGADGSCLSAELSKDMRPIWEEMSVLEKRIFFLSKGTDRGKELGAAEISKLSEFRCKKKFIEIVLTAVNEYLNYKKESKAETEKADKCVYA